MSRLIPLLRFWRSASPLVAAGLLASAASVSAQTVYRIAPPVPAFLNSISAEWLHADASPIQRSAMPSFSAAIGHESRSGWRYEVGYLRAARRETTAKGGTLGASRAFRIGGLNRLTLNPGAALLGGVAMSGGDHSGYDWRIDNSSVTGYQARYYPVSGATVGAGLSLGAEFRLIGGVTALASVQQWAFSGSIISPNRTPFLAGFGLSLRPQEFRAALRRSAQAPRATTTTTAGTDK